MIPDISVRSNQKEHIDEQDVTESEMIRNLKELDTFNRLTGNIAITLRVLFDHIKDQKKQYHILDLGCGGGQFLLQAHRLATKKKINLVLTGVDNNKTAISYLNRRISGSQKISAIYSDYRSFLQSYSDNVDIIHCSLFLHHLNDTEIIELIKTAQIRNSLLIINDLKRSIVAYYAVKVLTTLFNGTSLARNDGPVSVLKGFRKKEITELVALAGSELVSISPIPFYRYLIVVRPRSNNSL